MKMTKNIAVIGSGWYGCYITEYLVNKYPELNITIIDKNESIFTESSYNNQNRLHLGFHYPRCKITLTKCKYYYNKFIEKYKDLTETIENNIYGIENNSKISFEKYIYIFNKNDYTLIENNSLLKNIDGKLINTKEKYINFEKSKKYFMDKFNNKVKYKLNYNVNKIDQTEYNVIINNELYFDKVFNCTYNQINSKIENVIFEKCISLIYKNINNIFFDSLTIMDGDYFSIYKYKDDLYTLTDVINTPLIKDSDFDNVRKFELKNINNIINNFEKNVNKIYENFKQDFVYQDYFISYKCKNITNNDSRDINININSNLFNVWCGKISFIFELDKYIDDFIEQV